MDDEFLEEMEVALRLMRKQRRKALGQLSRLRDLEIVQEQLQQPVETVESTFIGGVLESLLKETIEMLRPDSEYDPDNVEWRNYIILSDFYAKDEPEKVVRKKLGIGHARFFDIRPNAIEAFAIAFYDKFGSFESRSFLRSEVKNNLRRPAYRYVTRVDEKGQDLVERAIRGLMKRPWVVSIRGFPGAGKTTLAMEVAQRCIEKAYYDAMIWIEARKEDEGYSTSLESIYNTIGETLDNRRIIAAESLEDKQSLAIKALLAIPKSLIVVDNTEVLSDEHYRMVYDFIRQVPMSTNVLLTSRERLRATELEEAISLFGMKEDEALEFMRNLCQLRGIGTRDEDLIYVYKATSGVPFAMRLVMGLMTTGRYTPQEALRGDIEQVDVLLEYLLEGAYGKLTDEDKKVLHVMPIFIDPAPLSAIAAASAIEGAHLRVCVNKLLSLFLINEYEGRRYDILAITRLFLLQPERIRDAVSLLEEETAKGLLETPYRNLSLFYQRSLSEMGGEERRQFVQDQWENLLNLATWCYENREPSLIKLLDAIGYWLGLRGYKRKRITWGELVVDMLKEMGDVDKAAWHLVYDIGWTLFQLGEGQKAKMNFQAGLKMAEQVDSQRVRGIALRNLAQVEREYENSLGTSKQLALEALKIFEQLENKRWIAICEGSLGMTSLLQDNYSEAKEYLEDALAINKEIDEVEGLISNLSDLALLDLRRGNFHKAEDLLKRSLRLALSNEIPEEEAYAKFFLGQLRETQGKLGDALSLVKQSSQIYKQFGARAPIVREVEQMLDRLQMHTE